MIKISSFQSLVLKNYLYGLFGVIAGLIVNAISLAIMDLLNLKSNEIFVRILIQVLLCSITLAIFEKFLLKDLALHWKTITPGFVFFSLFFGMQIELYFEATKLFKKNVFLTI